MKNMAKVFKLCTVAGHKNTVKIVYRKNSVMAMNSVGSVAEVANKACE